MSHNDVRFYINSMATTIVWLPSPEFMRSFVIACEQSENRVRVQLTGQLFAVVPDKTSRLLLRLSEVADCRYTLRLKDDVAERLYDLFGLRRGNEHLKTGFEASGLGLHVDLTKTERGRLSSSPRRPAQSKVLNSTEEVF